MQDGISTRTEYKRQQLDRSARTGVLIRRLLSALFILIIVGAVFFIFVLFSRRAETPEPDGQAAAFLAEPHLGGRAEQAKVERSPLPTGQREAPEERFEAFSPDEAELETYTLGQLLGKRLPWTFTQSLMLVNHRYGISHDFTPEMAEYRDSGVMMNVAMIEDYGRLSDSVPQKTGERMWVESVLRSPSEQIAIYEEDPERTAMPGHSEHHTGLAVDVHTTNMPFTDFLNSGPGRYVNDACWQFGFIVRYPLGREADTGIPFEPWHLRYVGQPHATIIRQNDWVFEQYIDALIPGHFFRFGDYVISRQSEKDDIRFPAGAEQIVCSPDNTGHYILTGILAAD